MLKIGGKVVEEKKSDSGSSSDDSESGESNFLN